MPTNNEILELMEDALITLDEIVNTINPETNTKVWDLCFENPNIVINMVNAHMDSASTEEAVALAVVFHEYGCFKTDAFRCPYEWEGLPCSEDERNITLYHKMETALRNNKTVTVLFKNEHNTSHIYDMRTGKEVEEWIGLEV